MDPRRRLFALLLVAVLAVPGASAAGRADFRGEQASAQARHVADWAVHSRDHAGQPFLVVDKKESRVFVFDADGRLRGSAAVLLGLATGDASVPGIGTRALSSIRPEERTTPAGRFVVSLDRNRAGEEILWVDYHAAIALHRVASSVPGEQRLRRLASPIAAERRITYGCINVPVRFFEDVVAPAFRASDGIAYVLPEGKPAREVFGTYDVAAPAAGPARR